MNRLAGMRGYLCGAMDRVDDGGIGWRRRLKHELEDLNVHWLDPTRKPIDIGIEDLENRQLRRDNKHQGDFDSVRREMKIVRCVDLRMVDICDFMPVRIDLDVHACGTYEEITTANRQKKPILAHVVQGKENAPDWLFGMLPHELIFSTEDEVCAYLRHIAHTPDINTLNRWYFFNFCGE